MKRILLCILSAIMTSAPSQALEVSGNTLTLSEEEADTCMALGGCVVVPRAMMEAAMQQAYGAGVASCTTKI